jgi:hypothetical protein
MVGERGHIFMTVYYSCPVCGADVDDDPEWVKKYPIKRCPLGQPYHEKCGYESHLDFCINNELCRDLKHAEDTCF